MHINDFSCKFEQLVRYVFEKTGYIIRMEKSRYAISNDFILWLLYKVDTGRNQIYQNNDFIINAVAIKAFNGKSSDEQSKAKFSGEAIMNMNSSYAFILESNNL